MDELDLGLVTVSLLHDAEALVVVLTGELDISDADAVRDALAPSLAGRVPRLVFDLAGLRFMDSSGIALMLWAARQCDDIVLRGGSPMARRVIEATGLSGVLRLEP